MANGEDSRSPRTPPPFLSHLPGKVIRCLIDLSISCNDKALFQGWPGYKASTWVLSREMLMTVSFFFIFWRKFLNSQYSPLPFPTPFSSICISCAMKEEGKRLSNRPPVRMMIASTLRKYLQPKHQSFSRFCGLIQLSFSSSVIVCMSFPCHPTNTQLCHKIQMSFQWVSSSLVQIFRN